MKKTIVLILTLIFITGCTNINKMSIEDSLNTLSYPKYKYNMHRVGYKYYLSPSLKVDKLSAYNEVITNKKLNFYLYVDMVSYYNKTNVKTKASNDNYYFNTFNYLDKSGYLNMSNLKEGYLIEIMYNYAKIEVLVPNEEDIKTTLIYAIDILGSIKYNDNVIENMLNDDQINLKEEEYNIFKTKSSDSKYLKYDNTYKEEEELKKDEDLIKQEGN